MTTTSSPAVRGVPTEADVGRRVRQADAPAAAIARSLMPSIEGPVAAKACAAGGTHMGCTAGALSRRLLRRAVATRGRHSACSSPRSRCASGGTRVGRMARALRQRRQGRAVASRERHSARPSRRERDTQPAAHAWAAWRASPPLALAGAVASRGRYNACSSRRARDAPAAAHTWAARRAPSASVGWGG